MTQVQFPDGFVWGVATAAYQIEGAVTEDGRGPSIWDTFSHTPGTTYNGDTGDVACDHYHRFEEDVALMQQLGVQAYRFSIAWPRVLPQGFGPPNEAGLAFYDRLIDALLAAHITPFVTLYHWDLPQALEDNGGWANRETVEAFVEYAQLVVSRYGSRVRHWITHNEPQMVTLLGYVQGVHAPGIQDVSTALQVAHHLLLSHGRAVSLIRTLHPAAEVGITLALASVLPATDSDADRAAASRMDAIYNRWFLDPLFGRGYPTELAALTGDTPLAGSLDLETIAAPIDFLGVNSYFPITVADAPLDEHPLGIHMRTPEEEQAAGNAITAMGWPVVPHQFDALLRHLDRTYAPKAIYITENGAAYDDQPENGAVHDVERTAFLRSHLLALHSAITAGVPVLGYFAWSFMDNFEWSHGYRIRFGLIRVDYDSQQRTIKDSGHWYRRVIEANALLDAES